MFPAVRASYNHEMANIDVERLGGLAGFGGPGSRLQSRGSVEISTLSARDRRAIDSLFAQTASASGVTPDGYIYRLTRHTEAGPESIEVAEQHVPPALRAATKDRIV